MAEITVIQPTEQPRRKLRCGAYCRVSTGREEQLHSFEAQRLWFVTLLGGSQTEELVDVYADVGISGTTADRPEFMRMLDDCRRGAHRAYPHKVGEPLRPQYPRLPVLPSGA